MTHRVRPGTSQAQYTVGSERPLPQPAARRGWTGFSTGQAGDFRRRLPVASHPPQNGLQELSRPARGCRLVQHSGSAAPGPLRQASRPGRGHTGTRTCCSRGKARLQLPRSLHSYQAPGLALLGVVMARSSGVGASFPANTWQAAPPALLHIKARLRHQAQELGALALTSALRSCLIPARTGQTQSQWAAGAQRHRSLTQTEQRTPPRAG